MTDTSLDPAIVARFRNMKPPYLGLAYIRLAQDIRDEAVAQMAVKVEAACAELDEIAERSGYGSIGVVVERLIEQCGLSYSLDRNAELTDG